MQSGFIYESFLVDVVIPSQGNGFLSVVKLQVVTFF